MMSPKPSRRDRQCRHVRCSPRLVIKSKANRRRLESPPPPPDSSSLLLVHLFFYRLSHSTIFISTTCIVSSTSFVIRNLLSPGFTDSIFINRRRKIDQMMRKNPLPIVRNRPNRRSMFSSLPKKPSLRPTSRRST